MRRFALRRNNDDNDRLELNGEHDIYLSTPSGLGWAHGRTPIDLSRGYYAMVGDSEPQQAMAATMIFAGSDPYGAYQSLLTWISAAGDTLELIYAPATVEYCRRVGLSYITKSEITPYHWLECPVELYGTTPWYLHSPTTLSADYTDDGLRYDYHYTPALRYGPDSTARAAVSIHPAGHKGAAIELTAPGPITNPVLELHGDRSGTLYGRCAIDAEIPAGANLLYSSRYLDSYIRYELDGETVDLLPYVDLRYDPLLRASPTESCTLTLDSDSTIAGAIVANIYYTYRSV